MNLEQLGAIWKELKEEASSAASTLRIYRALGKSAYGIRASYRPGDDREELLVEIPEAWKSSKPLPEWQGIEIGTVQIQFRSTATYHLSLTLMDSGSEDVFLYFVSDLTSELEGISDPGIRVETLNLCLSKWNRFFLKAGPAGLSIRSQMGLFGELCLLESILLHGLNAMDAMSCWKGPDHGYHDFDINGTVFEVKTTSSKEPRRIWINNERQLDYRGINKLLLIVFTISQTQGGGLTLVQKVDVIRNLLAGVPGAEVEFQKKLIASGYLQRHSERYKCNFCVLKKEMFLVTENTPRIIDLPSGIGDIRYSVLVSCCTDSESDFDDTLAAAIGGSNHDE